MSMAIGLLSLVVGDYDAAIRWFTQKLGFALIEDTPHAGAKRWVVVAPPGRQGAALLLARAADPRQQAYIGDQAGGRVFLFLYSDDIDRDYATFSTNGVVFEESPRDEGYGRVAVFRDLYGNRWDLIQSRRT